MRGITNRHFKLFTIIALATISVVLVRYEYVQDVTYMGAPVRLREELSIPVDSGSMKTNTTWGSSRCHFLDAKRNFNVSLNEGRPRPSNKMHVVLLYNRYRWLDYKHYNTLLPLCNYNNCILESGITKLKDASAVIFHFPSGIFKVQEAPVKPESRDPNQPWVFMGRESPLSYNVLAFRHSCWRNTLNWSMTYRLDADIWSGYGQLSTREKPPDKDYSAIYDSKTRMAAWIVSHCNAASKRYIFVKLLQNHGVQVDIFGKCGTIELKRSDTDTVLKQYKFYLAFENSLCTDYVTEKFFDRYNNDLILVTRGGADYQRLLPTGTYIDASQYNDTKTLARAMISLANNKDAYMELLRQKDRYEASGHYPFGWLHGFCDLCEKVNNMEKYRQSYPDPFAFLYSSKCLEPMDLV